MAVFLLLGLFYLSLGQPSPDWAGNHYKEANALFAKGSVLTPPLGNVFDGRLFVRLRVEIPLTNPHVKTKSKVFRPQIHLGRPPPNRVAVKVNQTSGNHRFGLDAMVGGPFAQSHSKSDSFHNTVCYRKSGDCGVSPHSGLRERIFIELVTSDRTLKASREGS